MKQKYVLLESSTGRKVHLSSNGGKSPDCSTCEDRLMKAVSPGEIKTSLLCNSCFKNLALDAIPLTGFIFIDDKPVGYDGRPLKWTTPEELEASCQEYFRSCWYYRVDSNGDFVLDSEGHKIPTDQFKPYTVSGLAVFLGTCRQTLLNYKEKDGFIDTIKNAKGRIEAYAEERLFTGKATGPIFNLKNNFPGWKDVFDLNTNNKSVSVLTDAKDVKEASQIYAEMVKGDGE